MKIQPFSSPEIKIRCPWPKENAMMIAYHDNEWGRHEHDDQKLFEFLVLESFQAGLSWYIVLKKRDNFRKAFANFDAKKVSRFDKRKIEQLLSNEGIIRNRMKIEAAINNAKCFLEIQKEFGSFDNYVWSFVNYKTIDNKRKSLKNIPASTPESDKLSNDMGKRGFKFRGTTICYAFMQATGMVNDHLVECFCYKECR